MTMAAEEEAGDMTRAYGLPRYLPGRLELARGTRRDYDELGRFHYRSAGPATWADVWVVRFHPYAGRDRLVGVAVLSWPIPALAARDRALNLGQMSARAKLRWVNRNLRTISRVAVHPSFRSLGLARALVRCALDHATTRYVEALAVMGRFHPFFAMAGMSAYAPDPTPPHRPPRPWYYLFDRYSFGTADERG